MTSFHTSFTSLTALWPDSGAPKLPGPKPVQENTYPHSPVDRRRSCNIASSPLMRIIATSRGFVAVCTIVCAFGKVVVSPTISHGRHLASNRPLISSFHLDNTDYYLTSLLQQFFSSVSLLLDYFRGTSWRRLRLTHTYLCGQLDLP